MLTLGAEAKITSQMESLQLHPCYQLSLANASNVLFWQSVWQWQLFDPRGESDAKSFDLHLRFRGFLAPPPPMMACGLDASNPRRGNFGVSKRTFNSQKKHHETKLACVLIVTPERRKVSHPEAVQDVTGEISSHLQYFPK